MSGIDWSKAPDWAEHFGNTNLLGYPAWIGNGKFMIADEAGAQVRHGLGLEHFSIVESRPSPAWNGEGLPPVGTVCEYQRVRDWVKVEVFAIKPNENGSYTALFTYENGAWAGCASPFSFRPIRTPEQIAADERAKACDRMYGVIIDNVPEDRRKNGSDIVEALYDAGYRKQEVQP